MRFGWVKLGFDELQAEMFERAKKNSLVHVWFTEMKP